MRSMYVAVFQLYTGHCLTSSLIERLQILPYASPSDLCRRLDLQYGTVRLNVATWQGFNDVRCTPDGRLLFDDLQLSPAWDKLYIKNLADLFRPASPDIRHSLDSFMRRRQEPVIAKEHLLSYYDIISVVASLHSNLYFPLERDIMFGKIFISDTLSDRHFLVDCVEDEPLPVRILIIPEPEAETLLELSSSLWR